MKLWLRRKLNRFAGWLKFRTCEHWWQATDPPGGSMPIRAALVDGREVRFRCHRCGGVRIVRVSEEAWEAEGWGAFERLVAGQVKG